MANPDIATYGLETRFQPGVSGNKKGRPKGSRSMSTVVKEILDDEELADKLLTHKPSYWRHLPDKNFASAVVAAMIIKAMGGDVRAATWLRQTGFGNKVNAARNRELKSAYVFDMRQENTRQYQA